MWKRKVTLSIEEEVLREAKVIAGLEGKSLSGLVEEYLGAPQLRGG